MGIFGAALDRIRNFGRTVPVQPQEAQFGLGWLPFRSAAGIHVTEEKAFTLSVFFACIKVIAEDLSKLPWEVFQWSPDGMTKTRRRNYVEYLLSSRPNYETSSFNFRHTVVEHALAWGNFYAEREIDLLGRTVALWQIEPDRVQPMRDEVTLEMFYRVTNRGAGYVDIPASQMFHVPGFSFDGRIGVPAMTYMAETLGEGIGMRDYSSAFFANDATPGGVLSTEQQLKQDTYERLRSDWSAQHRGARNAHKVGILEQGLKWMAMGTNNQHAQFIESRAFNIADILRFFRVPPHKVQHLQDASYNNIAELERAYAQDAIAPWAKKVEEEADAKLFGENRSRLFTRINMDELTRGDLKTRYEAYHIGRQGGWLNANEVRRREDMNDIEGVAGSTYWWPSNTVPADMAYDQAQIQPQADSGGGDGRRPGDDDDAGADIEDGRRRLDVHAVTGAFRRMLVSTSRRCYRREANWAKRQQKRTKSFADDLRTYLWSDGNVDHCRAEFRPVLVAAGESFGYTPGQTDDMLEKAVSAHLAISYRQLTGGAMPDPDLFDDTLAEAAVAPILAGGAMPLQAP